MDVFWVKAVVADAVMKSQQRATCCGRGGLTRDIKRPLWRPLDNLGTARQGWQIRLVKMVQLTRDNVRILPCDPSDVVDDGVACGTMSARRELAQEGGPGSPFWMRGDGASQRHVRTVQIECLSPTWHAFTRIVLVAGRETGPPAAEDVDALGMTTRALPALGPAAPGLTMGRRRALRSLDAMSRNDLRGRRMAKA